jgi:4-azaleucine resistance transporter AzlC
LQASLEKPTSLSPSQEFIGGVLDELPLLLGVIPFGLVYGVLSLQAGLPIPMAQGMSAIVFAGASQLVIAQLVAVGTPLFVIILTACVVNLRHALYSASIAPYLKPLKPAWKWLLAYLLTDEAYGVAIAHYSQPTNSMHKHWFLLGAGLTLWTGWQISTAFGIFLGAQIPPGWSLDFIGRLVFIALLVPMLKDKPGWLAALTGGIISVVAFGLPYKLGMLLAALLGIGVGLWSEGK